MQNRRKQKLIDWPIQGRILGLIIAAVLLTSLILGGFIWYCIEVINQFTYQVGVETALGELVISRLYYFGTLAVLGIIAVILFLLLLGIQFSHRLAGPLYRIRRDLEQMRRSGKINVIYTRAKDFHQELVRVLNHFLLDCRKQIKKNEEGEEESQ